MPRNRGEFERLHAPAGSQPQSAARDIPALLPQNRAVEKQAGLDAIEFRVVKSRRQRDYWLLLIAGNLVTAGLAALGGFNPIALIHGLAAAVIFSLGLTWIRWSIVDDY